MTNRKLAPQLVINDAHVSRSNHTRTQTLIEKDNALGSQFTEKIAVLMDSIHNQP